MSQQTITEDDTSKRVIDAECETLGIVSCISERTSLVDPDPGIADRIVASLASYAFKVMVALVVFISATYAGFGTGNVLTLHVQAITGIGPTEFQRFFEQVAVGHREGVGDNPVCS